MSEHAFEPEVVALLDEIARSSGPNLLRTPKERLLKWVGRPEEVISPHGSYLSKAEKYLVTAYREQAAAVLHAACVDRLAGHGDSGVFVESWRRPDMREVDRQAVNLGSCPSSDERIRGHLVNHTILSASQLAAASLRLAPSDQTRITLGDCFQVDGHSRAAMRMFEAVLTGSPTSAMRAVAHDNRGSVYCAVGSYSQALECFINAGRASEGRWKTAICRLIIELQLGAEEEALESAKLVASLKVNSDWICELIRFIERTRSASIWALTPQAERAINHARNMMPEEPRSICDALHPIPA